MRVTPTSCSFDFNATVLHTKLPTPLPIHTCAFNKCLYVIISCSNHNQNQRIYVTRAPFFHAAIK